MRAALALAVLASLASLHGAAAARGRMFAGEALGGGNVEAFHEAPLWRLDRAFHRTCLEFTCSASKARPAARGLPHAAGPTRRAALTLRRLRFAQKYEAFEGTDREDVLSRFKQPAASGYVHPRACAAGH